MKRSYSHHEDTKTQRTPSFSIGGSLGLRVFVVKTLSLFVSLALLLPIASLAAGGHHDRAARIAGALNLNAADAARLEASEGQTMKIIVQGVSATMPLKRLASLPPGVAGLPSGLPEAPVLSLPAWGTIEKAYV